MELDEALRTTGAIRSFTDDPVPHEVLHRVLDTARFAPSGGNRQAWRVVVVEDRERRRRLRDLYLPGWYEYLALRAAGLTPYSVRTDPEAARRATSTAGELGPRLSAETGGFAEHLDEVPVLLVLLADLGVLAAVDADLVELPLAAGASIYPFARDVLLAARGEGLGGVITTMHLRRAEEVRALVGAPEHLALAATLVLGWPQKRHTRLTRAPVEAFATVDTVDGAPLTPSN